MAAQDSRPSPRRTVRVVLIRALVFALLIVAASLFGSLISVDCTRGEERVDCRIDQGVDVPWTGGFRLVFHRQTVNDLQDLRWQRESSSRSPSSRGTTQPTGDVLLLIGHETVRVGWRDAAAPVRSFLNAPDRPHLRILQPQDPRGWLVSRALFVLAALFVIDVLSLLVLGRQRIVGWFGEPPDPDEPIPETALTRVGQVGTLLFGVGVLAFFVFGHRFVGPWAPLKVEALHAAVKTGDSAAVEKALGRGVSVDAVDESTGGTALQLAARLPSAEILLRLLEAGATAHVFDLSSRTPLHAAASRCELTAVRALLERGADADAMDESGWTPLRRAAEAGREDVVLMLIDAGSDVQRQGPHGWTPLHTAASHNHLGIVRNLLEEGALRGIRNENGHLPWDLASASELRELLADE